MAPRWKPKSKPLKDTAKDPSPHPNWPALKPLVDPSDLDLQTLLPDQILLIPNFFTTTLCRTYVNFLSTLPLTITPNKPKRGEAVRVNDRFQVQDPDFADKLWRQTSLEKLVNGFQDEHGVGVWNGEEEFDDEEREGEGEKAVLGLNPNIRIYRYRPGQFFDKHYDESNKLDFIPGEVKGAGAGAGAGQHKPPIPAKTTWTLLIYLTTCQGGETVFYPESAKKGVAAPPPVVVEVQAGLALLHRHGAECLLHEGREVTGTAEKWVIRSDLVVKR